MFLNTGTKKKILNSCLIKQVIIIFALVSCDQTPKLPMQKSKKKEYTFIPPMTVRELLKQCRDELRNKAECSCLESAYQGMKGKPNYEDIKHSPTGRICLVTKDGEYMEGKNGTTADKNSETNTISWEKSQQIYQNSKRSIELNADSDAKGNKIISWIHKTAKGASVIFKLEVEREWSKPIGLSREGMIAENPNAFIMDDVSIIIWQEGAEIRMNRIINTQAQTTSTEIITKNAKYFSAAKDAKNKRIIIATEQMSGTAPNIELWSIDITTGKVSKEMFQKTLTNSERPFIAFNNTGQGALAYFASDDDNATKKVLVNRYLADQGTWENAKILSGQRSETSSAAKSQGSEDIEVTMNDAGEIHVVWVSSGTPYSENQPYYSDIYYNKVETTGDQGTAKKINQTDSSENSHPQIYSSKTNKILILWRSRDKKKYQTIYSHIISNEGTTILAPRRIDKADISTSWDTAATALDNGEFLVTYSQWNQERMKYILKSSYSNTIGWQQPSLLFADKWVRGHSTSPFLLKEADQNVTLLWRIYSDEQSSIEASSLTSISDTN